MSDKKKEKAKDRGMDHRYIPDPDEQKDCGPLGCGMAERARRILKGRRRKIDEQLKELGL